MLNEDKIKLMTSISMFEKKEGKRMFPARQYFRSDYIGSHILRSFLGYTFCWLAVVGAWILYNIEDVFGSLVLDDLWRVLLFYGIFYGIGLLLYLMITFHISSKRYSYASRGLKMYVAKLKRLEKRYEFNNKTKELVKEGVRR